MVETLKNQRRKEKDLARDRGIERKGIMFRKYLEWLEKMSWTNKRRGQEDGGGVRKKVRWTERS